MKRYSTICFILFLILFTACFDSGGGSSSDTPLMGSSIVGSWGMTYLEGAPTSVNSSNSTWVFNSDGSYTWFLYYEGYFDEDDSGTYTIDGNTICVTGNVGELAFGGDCFSITPGSDLNSFSLKDDEGDKWTYERL